MDLADVEAEFGEPASAFDHVTLALRNYHDSGNTTMIGGALGSSPLCSTGSDATNAAATSEVSRAAPASHCFPEITATIAHLRDVLGDQTYESLARKGAKMTTSAMVAFAYDQVDQARRIEQLR